MTLGAGEVFAGYTVVRFIGAGGMGEVYLVRHPRLPGRLDALKLLSIDISADRNFQERFLREANLASTLSHQHIVGVIDRGEDHGRLWIAMDYIDGEDAAQLLRRRFPAGMPVEIVAAIVTAVGSALDYAYSKGLLHRDVKPANILLSHADDPAQRRVLLTDFGIARSLDDVSDLTPTNTTLGTVAYSSPEQLMGQELDGRTDQYSLAATAYQLLTGTTMFPVSNAAVIIGHHLTADPPPLSGVRPELAALDPVLRIALAKDPAGRFSSCTDFARVFAEQACGGSVSPAAPTAPAELPTAPPQPTAGAPPSPNRSRWVLAAGFVAMLTLGLLLARGTLTNIRTASTSSIPTTAQAATAPTLEVTSNIPPNPPSGTASPPAPPPTALAPQPSQSVDRSCTKSVNDAIATAARLRDQPVEGEPVPEGFTQSGLFEGTRLIPVVVPTHCVQDYLTDLRADGIYSLGGDKNLVIGGLIACRSAGSLNKRILDDTDISGVRIQTEKAEFYLSGSLLLNHATGEPDGYASQLLTRAALVRLCPT